jgi:hypothetical protein
MTTVVVDTNVILVANRQHGAVSEACITACELRLYDIVQRGRVAIDNEYLILAEYQRKTAPHVGKRAGDTFVKWLLRNNANQKRCDQVALEVHVERGFESFPEDSSLRNFDPPDRKFVAVAAAHLDKPPILQAADSKWVDWAPALTVHGVKVDFLCLADIRTFDKNKKKSKAKRR